MNRKFVVGVIGVTVLVLVAGVVAAVKWPASSATLEMTGGKLELEEKTYDWGDIPIDGGNAVKIFEAKNIGAAVLELADFATSCMCTTAIVETTAGESPAFGMHEQSAWRGRVGPGETAKIKVIFDPAYHGPGGKGLVTRVVSFRTSDPDNKKVELWLKGKII